MPPPDHNPARTDTRATKAHAGSRSAGGNPSPAPGLSAERRGGAPGRRENQRPAPSLSSALPISPAEAQSRIRATMQAHIAAAAKIARIETRSTRTLEGGALEMTFEAQWGIVRGWPRLTWTESTRELVVSVKTLWGESLVHIFVAKYPEHYGVIAQTAVSLVVARAR